MTGLNQLAKRTFRTEWTHPRLHCSIQVALSLSAESATCLQQCPRLNTVLPYYRLKKQWIPELQVISDAYARYKSVISGKPEVHHISFFFFFLKKNVTLQILKLNNKIFPIWASSEKTCLQGFRPGKTRTGVTVSFSPRQSFPGKDQAGPFFPRGRNWLVIFFPGRKK